MNETKIIGLTGWAQTGKDVVGGILEEQGFHRVAFADALKELAARSNPTLASMLEVMDWEKAKKEPWVRKYLQDLGQACRDVFDESIWVVKATEQAMAKLWGDHMTGYVAPGVVFTDVRYPNEANAIRESGGEVWEIRRPGRGPVNDFEGANHGLDESFVDKVIENGKTLQDLKALVLKALSEWSPSVDVSVPIDN